MVQRTFSRRHLASVGVALLWSLTCIPTGSTAQDTAKDCAVFEQLYDQSGLTFKWTRGQCCNADSGIGDGHITCNDAGRIVQAYLPMQGFTGCIPEIRGLDQLQQIYLYSNQLTGFVPSFTGMLNLQWISFWNNSLTGPIPPSLSTLVNLVRVYLDANHLTGPIPDLRGLTKLDYGEFYRNNLTGSVDSKMPAQLGHCYLTYDNTNPGLYSCTQDYPATCLDRGDVIRRADPCPQQPPPAEEPNQVCLPGGPASAPASAPSASATVTAAASSNVTATAGSPSRTTAPVAAPTQGDPGPAASTGSTSSTTKTGSASRKSVFAFVTLFAILLSTCM
ncbi:hypothetical protein M427DRAFT_340290 [Gonapodya prolifera JEL478]|uniref:L domain-like protein n=1 Tax=Gonapodya prolifera (strain JEL478) TaxID=1344416 RepID=A0A139ADX9_GONPJ|nr:hypothetical protein M427DRAFT_340290 [Gonapodya prolifera JEL478]|eukprot:KXS14623.1 hypothetical protein M427DRAFT_340290 [Gonapodya prolifera JEL478]